MATKDSKELTIKRSDGIEKVVDQLFSIKTPAKYIKTRPGPGNMVFQYVEIGYIINALNAAFGPLWEFKVVDKHIGDTQIWVQGQLTVKGRDGFSVTKEQFGGADVKKYSQGSPRAGQVIDLANDLKAASSDALKKAASLFGIAHDVFYKASEQYDLLPDEVEPEDENARFAMNKFFAVASARGFTPEKAKDIAHRKYKVDSMTELNAAQISAMTENLIAFYEEVEAGKKPRKIGEEEPADDQLYSEFVKPTVIEVETVVEGHALKVDPQNVAAEDESPDEVTLGENDFGTTKPRECYTCGKTTHKEATFDGYYCSQDCKDAYYNSPPTKANASKKFDDFLDKKRISDA